MVEKSWFDQILEVFLPSNTQILPAYHKPFLFQWRTITWGPRLFTFTPILGPRFADEQVDSQISTTFFGDNFAIWIIQACRRVHEPLKP